MTYFAEYVNNFKSINTDHKVMFLSIFFMKIGQFMLLPFLAIYLTKSSNLSLVAIGLIIGSGPFVYSVTGLWAGVLIDRFDVRIAVIFSLLLGGLSLFFFFQIQHIFWFILMNILTGIARAFFDVASKTYGLSSLNMEMRKFCFSLRFMMVNSAAAIGPAIGAYFATRDSLSCFKIIGLLYFLLGLLSPFILHSTNKNEISENRALNLAALFNITIADKCLQILLVINFLIWVIYSQLDSTLAQYLNDELDNGVRIYSSLLEINAIGCAVLQVVISQFTKNMEERLVSYAAMLLFAIAYVIMALFSNTPALISAAIIIVFAEVTIMPLNDYLIIRIAPPHRIGTYYGIMGLAMLGLGIGPILGSIIYETNGAKSLFLICSLSCLFSILLYKKLINGIMLRENKCVK